ncbi:formyltetrahydrofolate deformylase [Oleisolibacter albus]|uniref:formyltetrahydrofolate deformylase n=1 Tax=Oleisolibacter albus TaxID=2171757 RepID=UPI000DF1E9F2|nr:formyltetrahydrofolate deformylase [Oleisolibacter albus]
MVQRFVLTLSCPDTIGIVAGISGALARYGANILDSAQFGDTASGRFFLRLSFAVARADSDALQQALAEVGHRFAMDLRLTDLERRPRVLILVSKFGHCLNDLLYRYRIGDLAMDIPAIVSNHPDFAGLADWHGISFHHIPVTAAAKQMAEEQLLDLVERHGVDLVVLARYMQVLSPDLCRQLAGRCINIHHSFLPSFKGAKPYHQAYARGVKLIGATAHYVTTDLDEGPIIEQEVERVDHTQDPEALVAAGRDIECRVLARAVKYHLEQRVLLNGHRTVIFR